MVYVYNFIMVLWTTCVFAGLFMALQPRIIACGNTVASFAMAVRFLTGPAVMAFSSFVVGLRGVLLHIAIVQVLIDTTISFFIYFLVSLDSMNECVFCVFLGCSSPRNSPFCVCQGIQCSS